MELRHTIDPRADLNADGEMNALDAAAILRYAAQAGIGNAVSWAEMLGK